ncbi:uncharacterized protein IWZ02DRAFT_63044 [Phyllosticta citriasiana]|uniref:Uncharacterized protein n=1 Tax=Phyllosticta citriasiana TaxID=595635 RepID=A0ABR1L5W1_9PEZI
MQCSRTCSSSGHIYEQESAHCVRCKFDELAQSSFSISRLLLFLSIINKVYCSFVDASHSSKQRFCSPASRSIQKKTLRNSPQVHATTIVSHHHQHTISSKATHLSNNATGTKRQPRHRNPRHQSQPESTAGRQADRHGNIPNHTRARILQPGPAQSSPSLQTSGTILDDQTLQTLPSSLLHYLSVDDDEGPRSSQTQMSPPPRRVVASFSYTPILYLTMPSKRRADAPHSLGAL